MYDAVWMIAHALNNSIEVLARKNLALTDFTYENDEIRQVFVEQLSRLEFRGVSVSNISLLYTTNMCFAREMLLSTTENVNQTSEWSSTDVRTVCMYVCMYLGNCINPQNLLQNSPQHK